MHLLLINPNTSQVTTGAMRAQVRACLPECVRLSAATARAGAAMITDEAGLRVAAQEVLALGLEFAAQAPGPGQRPGILVAAFGNPGLAALRQQLPAHVLAWGIGEAAMLEAAQGGRFGVATTTPGLEASIARAAGALGLAELFCGTRLAAGEPLALAADPDQQRQALLQAAGRCIRLDGARAVIIGGGPLAAAADWLAPRLAAPVISPLAAAARAVLRAWGLLPPGENPARNPVQNPAQNPTTPPSLRGSLPPV